MRCCSVSVALPETMAEAQSAEGAPCTPRKMHQQHKWWTPVLQDAYYLQAGTGNPKTKHCTWLTASLVLFSTYQKTLRRLKMHFASWQGKEPPTINPPSNTQHRAVVQICSLHPPRDHLVGQASSLTRCWGKSSTCLPKRTPPPISNH